MHRLLPLALVCLTLTRTDASKPNVVFIYTDDQAPFAVQAAGDNRFITPNIDRIFHEGAHLTQSFVTTQSGRIDMQSLRHRNADHGLD